MEAVSKMKGVTIKKKINDHWAFLEHIEAPMWVDLTLEAKSGGADTDDDDWFNTSHVFHQMSARELKSKFSHGEDILTSEVDLKGVNSPALPSSVSRSRGKHYNIKKWEGIDLNTLFDKQKGLTNRGFKQGSSFGQEVKPKSKFNVNSMPKGLSSGNFGLASEQHAKGKAESKAPFSNTVSSSSSDLKTGESSLRSVITSENTQKDREVSSRSFHQKKSSSIRRVSLGRSRVTGKVSRIQPQKKCVEVSSLLCNQKIRTSSSDHHTAGSTGRSTFSSESTQKCREVSSKPCNQKRSSPVRRVNLRKSHVTRKVSSILPQKKCLEVSSQPYDQKSRSSSIICVRRSYVSGEASKVESGGDSMQSRGRTSSSGKSSVGSCSNPGYEVKFVSKQQREKIRDEKGEVTMNLTVNNRCKPGEILKTSAISVEKGNGDKKGSNISFPKPAYHRTAKSLVSTSSRALLQHSVNKENTFAGSTKEKPGTIKVNSFTVRKKCPTKGVSAGGAMLTVVDTY